MQHGQAGRRIAVTIPNVNLRIAMQGLAFVCSAASLEGEEVQERAEDVLVALLGHPQQPVQLAVYALLETLVAEVSSTMNRCASFVRFV